MSNDLYGDKDLTKDDQIVCYCQEVTVKTIKDAIKNGAKTVEEIGLKTDAGITCGVCIEDIEELLKKY